MGLASRRAALRWHHRPPWEPLKPPRDPSQPLPAPPWALWPHPIVCLALTTPPAVRWLPQSYHRHRPLSAGSPFLPHTARATWNLSSKYLLIHLTVKDSLIRESRPNPGFRLQVFWRVKYNLPGLYSWRKYYLPARQTSLRKWCYWCFCQEWWVTGMTSKVKLIALPALPDLDW